MLINKNIIKTEYLNVYSLTNKKIAIPIFQRFYDWKEKQIQETLNDVIDSISSKEKQIYLLDFIWYEEDGFMKIADGQQRLVSLNILHCAINNYIDENGLKIKKIKLFDIVYDNAKYNAKYVTSFTNYFCSPFKKMYLYLYDFVKENSFQLGDIINSLKRNIYVFVKQTETADDAFNIFTQINTGGKPLTKDEVIRTTLDQYAVIYSIPFSNTSKDLKKAIVSYHKFTVSSAGKDFDTIAIISFMKNYIVKNRDTFKSFVEFLNLLKNVADFSISYIISYINRSQLNDVLNVMMMKGIDLRARRDYLYNVLFPLCLLSIVMTIKKSNPGGIIRTLYSGVIDSIKAGKTANKISEEIAEFINANYQICKINYNDFIIALGSKDLSTNIKKSLLIMDVMRTTTSSDLNVPSINLEHIYPQKPASEWAMNSWPTSSEEKSALINNIGNYLLLNQVVNNKIKNKYITEKVIEYNIIIPRDRTLQTETNAVDFHRFELEKNTYIIERQKKIGELIYNNFTLATVIIEK